MTAAIYDSLVPALRAGYLVYAPLQLGYLLRRRDDRGEWYYAEVHLKKEEVDRVDVDDDLSNRIKEFLNTVSDARDAVADVDVPGWIVSKPTIAELNADIAIMVLRAKDGDSIPFVLPVTSEASIAVLTGSVRVISASLPGGSVALKHNFCVLPPGIDRLLVPLEPDTRVYCTFFRARVSDDGTEHSVSAR